MPDHTPHRRIERRKELARNAGSGGFNQWLAVKITDGVGSMWCAYVFAIICLISLPQAIGGGTAPLITWICQTFLQLVLLSIIIVGQNVVAEKSELQLENTYKDVEALLEIHDEMHQLVKVNEELTERVHTVLTRNTDLTKQLNAVISADGFISPRAASTRRDCPRSNGCRTRNII